MKIQINCTANLGDFLNAMPILSGINKKEGKFDLIIRKDMEKFNGIIPFLEYQEIFNSISFDDEIFVYGDILNLSSWSRFERNDPNRPIETCRYENWLKDKYNIQIESDDDFILKVPETEDNYKDKILIGDRWSVKEDPSIDTRRKTYVIRDSGRFNGENVFYLDYTQTLLHNASIIKSNPNTFYTTFTGVGIMADLMKKDTVVFYDDDMENWDGHPVKYDFERHYYGNRNSVLKYIKED